MKETRDKIICSFFGIICVYCIIYYLYDHKKGLHHCTAEILFKIIFKVISVYNKDAVSWISVLNEKAQEKILKNNNFLICQYVYKHCMAKSSVKLK